MEQERKISKPSMIGSILLLAGAVFLLNLLVPPSLPSRILSLLLTSALLLAFTLSDFRRLTQAESKVAYLGRRWLDLSVLGLLFLFSGAKAVTLARMVGNPQQAVALTPGTDFGSNRTQHCVRLAYTRDAADLEEAVARLARFCA